MKKMGCAQCGGTMKKMAKGGAAGDCKNNSKNRCGVYPDCVPCTSQKIAAGVFSAGAAIGSAIGSLKGVQRAKAVNELKRKAEKEGKDVKRSDIRKQLKKETSLPVERRGGSVKLKRKK